MANNPGGKKWWKAAVGRFFSWILVKSWKQWLILAVALVLAILGLRILFQGSDYRKDPSALVPRSAHFYAETRDLGAFFKNASGWSVWTQARRDENEVGQWPLIQKNIAEAIGGRIAGLGTRLPLNWMSKAKRAALSVEDSDTPGELTWAIYLNIGQPAESLNEIGVESTITIETVAGTREEGVFVLKEKGDAAKLYLASIGPWLIISPDEKLPKYAFDGYKKPSLTLARSEIVGSWNGSSSIRGVVNPSQISIQPLLGTTPVVKSWLEPKARLSFGVNFTSKGVDAKITTAYLQEKPPGGGLWPLVNFVLAAIGFIGLMVALAVVLTMLGKGAWLKALAVKSGIFPASAPARVTPSAAFQEDSGMATAEDAVDVVDTEKATAEDKTGDTIIDVEYPADEPSSDTSESSKDATSFVSGIAEPSLEQSGGDEDKGNPDTKDGNL